MTNKILHDFPLLICQSCGIPLESDEDKGTEKAGLISHEFCVHCYQDGKFKDDISLEQMIDRVAGFMTEFGAMEEKDAQQFAKTHVSGLKRWN